MNSIFPPEPVILLTDSTIAKQVLVSTLSRCVQQADSGTVTLTLRAVQLGWMSDDEGYANIPVCLTISILVSFENDTALRSKKGESSSLTRLGGGA